MNPSALIPAPDPLQVPWGWFQALLTLTLFLHILVMNVMFGTAVIAFVNLFRSAGETDSLARDVSGKLPFAIAFTVNFGIAPLLFVQVLYGHFMYTSSVLMANFWLMVIPLLIAAYYLAYIFSYRYDSLKSGRVVLIGGVVFMLLMIGFMMSNNFTLMQRPAAWLRYFDNPNGTLLNLADPTIFPRFFHFMTAAIAIGGLATALYYEFKKRKGDPEAAARVATGCRWFGYATIVNFGFGFWFFGSLPQEVFTVSTLSGRFMAILLPTAITLGILAVIASLRGRVLRTLFTVLPAVFAMILVRDLVRVAYLRPYFSVTELPRAYQYSPMLLFLLFLVGGILLVAWMLRLTWKSSEKEEVQP